MSIDDTESRLRAVTGEADPVPSLVLDSARAAFTMRAVDAELAELVADSAYDDEGLLTRSVVSDVRMLSFECGTVTGGDRRRERPVVAITTAARHRGRCDRRRRDRAKRLAHLRPAR